jgi:L-fuconolactonase
VEGKPVEIIDAQLHMPRPWAEWNHGEESLFDLAGELVLAHMDAAGVNRAVLSARPDWCRVVLPRYPDRLAAIWGHDETADDIEEQVAGTLSMPGVIGIRVLASWPPENIERFRAGAFDALFDAAERHNVPVCVFVSGNLPDLAPVASRYPDLTLVIDHFGLRQPPFSEIDDPPWRGIDDLVKLAEFPNVSAKVSGAPTLSAEPYPFPDIWPHLDRVFTAFGIGRCMWGSDQHRVFGRVYGRTKDYGRYPGYHSYAEALHYLLDSNELSKTDKQGLLGGNLRRIMRWEGA